MEIIPYFYDIVRGVHLCRLDGAMWEWPYAAHFRGSAMPAIVSAEWVRKNAKRVGGS